MTNADDRFLGQRRFRRIRSQNAILVTKREDEKVEDLISTNSISAGGCGFISHEKLGVDALVSLLISIRHHVVKATGRVVYERPLEDGTYDVGVEFLDIAESELDRIEDLFEQEKA